MEFYNIKKRYGKVEVSIENLAISTNQLFGNTDSKGSDGLIYFDTNVKATMEFGVSFCFWVARNVVLFRTRGSV